VRTSGVNECAGIDEWYMGFLILAHCMAIIMGISLRKPQDTTGRVQYTYQ